MTDFFWHDHAELIVDTRTGKLHRSSGEEMHPSMNACGYLRLTFSRNGVRYTLAAHRLIWEAVNGPIPRGLQIDHINAVKTDNRLANLDLVTRKENNYRSKVLGLHHRKLTADQVRKAREDRRTDTAVAADLGVCRKTVAMLRSRQTWAHIE